jgi:hypothetical protein
MQKHSHTKLSKAMLYTQIVAVLSVVTAMAFAMYTIIVR